MTNQQQQAFDAMREALERLIPYLFQKSAMMTKEDWAAFDIAHAALAQAKEVTAQGVEAIDSKDWGTVVNRAEPMFWKGGLDNLSHKAELRPDPPEDMPAQQPAPAQRLSDDEIEYMWLSHDRIHTFARAIETAFAAKNGITLEQK